MANISILTSLIDGAQRSLDLSANTLVVDILKVGGSSGTDLTKAILDRLVSLQNGSDLDATYHTHNTLYVATGLLTSVVALSAGSTVIGDDNSYSNFTPAAATVKGALSGIDAALGSATAVSALDGTFRIKNTADHTKQVAFDASAITTATTRTITMPDANVNLADVNQAILQNGTRAFTADQAMGAHKLTGLAAGSAAGDAVRYEQAILASGVNAWSANQDLGGFKITGSAAPTLAGDLANKKYVDDSITAATPTAASVSYDHTTSGLAATTVQAAIDEVEGRLATAEGTLSSDTTKIGHLQTLSGVASGSDDLGTFTGTTIPDTSTNKAALQALETAVELRALDSAVVKKDGSVSMTGDLNLNSHKIVSLSDPVSSQDAVTLSYMNARLSGLKPKQSTRAATTANIDLSSALINAAVVDGVTLVTGDRVLVKAQTAPAQNGIYIVAASGAASRSTDFDQVSPVDEINGSWIAIQEGTIAAGMVFVQYGTVATIGTDPINFETYNPIAGLIGGDMITFAGSVFSVDLATVSGLESSNPGNVAGQLRVKLESGTSPSLKIDGSNQLGINLYSAGGILASPSGVKINLDNSSVGVSSGAYQVEVRDTGITAAKLNTNTFDQVTIVGGAGTAASVAKSPILGSSEVAGEAFAAAPFAVRLAKAADAGFVAGRVYKADIDTTSADNFHVIGLVNPASSVSAGGAINVVEMGAISVPSHGFTVGLPIFLTASGTMSNTAPTTSKQAVVILGYAKDANTIFVKTQIVGVN